MMIFGRPDCMRESGGYGCVFQSAFVTVMAQFLLIPELCCDTIKSVHVKIKQNRQSLKDKIYLNMVEIPK